MSIKPRHGKRVRATCSIWLRNGGQISGYHSWEENWTELSTFFDYPYELRCLLDTTNLIEGYNRQLRKVTKDKSLFPTDKSMRKLFYLAHRQIEKKWSLPLPNWAKIRNQLAIRFEGRYPL